VGNFVFFLRSLYMFNCVKMDISVMKLIGGTWGFTPDEL
jgi:hypothetical protein